MRPELEWHVGEDSDPESVVKTSLRNKMRRSPVLIAIVVALGVGLGLVYRSLPDILPRLIPTPTAPPIPADLLEVIDRAAQHLADDTIYSNEAAWGRPSVGPFYTILDFGFSTPTEAWVDTRQFRHGRFFRITRFYSKRNGQWGPSYNITRFWSGQIETFDTPHLHFIYPVEDRLFIPPLAHQLEEIYTTVCADLACDLSKPAFTFTLTKTGETESVSKDDLIIGWAPRATGCFEGEQPIQSENSYLARSLIRATAQRVAYGYRFREGGGRIVIDVALDAISQWAQERTLGLKFDPVTKFDPADSLPLSQMWKPFAFPNEPAYPQMQLIVRFIDHEYGPLAVGKFLKMQGTAGSFANAIEDGLGVSFAEFNQKWQTWLASYFAGNK